MSANILSAVSLREKIMKSDKVNLKQSQQQPQQQQQQEEEEMKKMWKNRVKKSQLFVLSVLCIEVCTFYVYTVQQEVSVTAAATAPATTVASAAADACT